MSERGLRTRGRLAVVRAGVAARAATRVRGARAVLVGTAVVYLGLYLLALGHLRPGVGSFDLLVVADPLSRAVRPLGFLSFEPVARVDLGVVRLLVSPVNLLLGTVLAGLVGVNLAVSYLAWRHPAACGIEARRANASGLLAGLPALLSGAACCGPVVLVALGVQATGLLLSTFRALVPAAVLLLVASLLYVSRSVDPTRARRTP
jgi:hypothetical protein